MRGRGYTLLSAFGHTAADSSSNGQVMTHQRNPFIEGATAYFAGISRDACPHDEGSAERTLWIEGWGSGRQLPDLNCACGRSLNPVPPSAMRTTVRPATHA